MTTLMHDMQYRMQNGCQQSSYNQPPHTSYYLGSETGVPARPNIKLNNTPPEPVNGKLIKNFLVKDSANADGWKLMSSNTTGGLIYGDRDFTYTSLSYELQNSEYIMTACNSKNTDADLAEFTADKDMEVYVMVDDREEAAGLIPYWLSGYTKTSLTAESSNGVTFTAYKKAFSAGDKVVLGTNGMTGYVVNYTVFVKEQATSAPLPAHVENIRVNYNTQYHQIQFVWDKTKGADKYGIAVYLAGKWRVQNSNITTNSFVTPKNLTPGKTYRVAIAARVNGQWDTSYAVANAVTVTVR